MSLTTQTDNEVVRVLRASLYPGAKTESIELVLSYCRVNGLDPMLKPVHIVPTSVKNERGDWEMRDVLMPGIADYRIKAARSGEYIGKSEPVFGPVRSEKLDGVAVTYPEWCQITVYRMVNGQRAEFPAREYWLENYATKKRDSHAPNAMWQKRAFGQLAKCAEAQALRMAFPEFSGGAVTAEEMEGKTLEGVVIADDTRPAPPAVQIAEPTPADKAREWAEGMIARLDAARVWEDVQALVGSPALAKGLEKLHTLDKAAAERLEAARQAAMDRAVADQPPPATTEVYDLENAQ